MDLIIMYFVGVITMWLIDRLFYIRPLKKSLQNEKTRFQVNELLNSLIVKSLERLNEISKKEIERNKNDLEKYDNVLNKVMKENRQLKKHGLAKSGKNLGRPRKEKQ